MMRSDVFVSYSQDDRSCAFEIVAQLEACGLKVWVAPRDIAPSSDWAADIIDAIAASRLMVLVFSAACNISPQVRREVERAVHRQLPILPFRVEDVLPTKSMEYFLSAQHWLDAFPPPLGPHYERLCRQVKAILQTGSGEQAHAAAVTALTATHTFRPEEIHALQRRLAEDVGPLAGFLVMQAAASAGNWNQLIDALAPEIDALTARQDFIASCRRQFADHGA
jgi:TIR domain